jgi:hypothetical protein
MMTQSELNRAVARATGDTIKTIDRLGFTLAESASDPEPDNQRGPLVVDWDELEDFRWAA